MGAVNWNQAAALQRVDGDVELLIELVEVFFQDYPDHLSCLMQALAQHDFTGVRKTAHTLKGSLGYLGAWQGEQLARDIEQASQSADAARVRQLVSTLAAYIETLREIMLFSEGEQTSATCQCRRTWSARTAGHRGQGIGGRGRRVLSSRPATSVDR
jgi:HPt (histidine-containing phosphotransfer) domain-containing protein